jgi:hypothetical protein
MRHAGEQRPPELHPLTSSGEQMDRSLAAAPRQLGGWANQRRHEHHARQRRAIRGNAGRGAARGGMSNRGAKAGPDGEVPDTPD